MNKDLEILNCNKISFDRQQNIWVTQEKDLIQKNIKIESFNLLTYNVWFDNYNWENRLDALLKIIEEYSPDIICLQEVTQKFIDFLMKSEFIKNTYFLYLVPFDIHNWYDVSILSKFSGVCKVSPFFSYMERKLLFLEIIAENITIKVGCVHLESLDSEEIRKVQLINSYGILDKNIEKNYLNILAGDFNFQEKETFNILSSGYTDVGFEEIKLNEGIPKEKNNFDYDISKYCTMKGTKRFPPWRPDRVTYKSNASFSIKYEVIGSNEIKITDTKNPINTPSDHLGLYLKFSLNKTNCEII